MHWRDRLSLETPSQSETDTDDECWALDTSNFVVVHRKPSEKKKFYHLNFHLTHQRSNRNKVFDFWRNLESGQVTPESSGGT